MAIFMTIPGLTPD